MLGLPQFATPAPRVLTDFFASIVDISALLVAHGIAKPTIDSRMLPQSNRCGT